MAYVYFCILFEFLRNFFGIICSLSLPLDETGKKYYPEEINSSKKQKVPTTKKEKKRVWAKQYLLFLFFHFKGNECKIIH